LGGVRAAGSPAACGRFVMDAAVALAALQCWRQPVVWQHTRFRALSSRADGSHCCWNDRSRVHQSRATRAAHAPRLRVVAPRASATCVARGVGALRREARAPRTRPLTCVPPPIIRAFHLGHAMASAGGGGGGGRQRPSGAGQVSILEDMGESSSTCGYCHQAGDTSVSRGACVCARRKRCRAGAHTAPRRAGMWAHRLLVDDYQGACVGRHAARPDSPQVHECTASWAP
jgi:hypothetical protein